MLLADVGLAQTLEGTCCPSCSIGFSSPKRYIASCSPPPRRIPSSGFLLKFRICWKFDHRRKSTTRFGTSILANERSSRWPEQEPPRKYPVCNFRPKDIVGAAGHRVRWRDQRRRIMNRFPCFSESCGHSGHQSSPKRNPRRFHGEFRSNRRSNDSERKWSCRVATILPILHVNINRVDRQDSGRE